ncbi:MAG: hypothetical protein KKA79_01590 [Nanoarchaeota archaeon]|nr:hypothetical protein [Nanoarchaeota archaeon]
MPMMSSEDAPADYYSNGRFIPRRLADAIMQRYRFRTLRDTGEVFYYNDGVYHPNGETLIKEEVSSMLQDGSNERRAKDVIFFVRTATYIDREEINANKDLVLLKNGVFDLMSMSLKPFTPEIISTIQIPIEYNPNADCPMIKQFHSEILPKDDIPVVQELFGYSLLKGYPIQKAFMFIGSGANGKSTLMALLTRFLGQKNVSSVALQDFDMNRFATSCLYNKMANIHPDITNKSLYQTGRFKMLVGGDLISAEQKFRNTFTFVNHAKLIFSANQLPETQDDSDAFYRRWVIINFPNIFEGEKADAKILEKLTTPEELSGLFNWAVEGLKRLLETGRFSYHKSTEQIRNNYERLSNPLVCFIKDEVEIAPMGSITKDVLYSAFVEYCKKNALPVKAKNVVGRELPKHISVSSERTKIGGIRIAVWKGISLNGKDGEDGKDNSYFNLHNEK